MSTNETNRNSAKIFEIFKDIVDDKGREGAGAILGVKKGHVSKMLNPEKYADEARLNFNTIAEFIHAGGYQLAPINTVFLKEGEKICPQGYEPVARTIIYRKYLDTVERHGADSVEAREYRIQMRAQKMAVPTL